ncbi:MAG: efflux transporter outer membrane subunit [Pseudomonadales bacterium]|nr:efflux transporter outer membrane subunit [Pseudomonadales bacterium]MCP5331088.1 efflux transporter outer membrane subunit [Pseudomonadales bacterium]MCP5343551.1 efflux transporter outer membrane subunit [Pseudomonadales bacterium]
MRKRQLFPVPRAGLMLLPLLLASCTSVGPDYQAPDIAIAPNWAPLHGGDPSLADVQRSRSEEPVSMLEGFALFADADLQALQTRALENNADLRMALLRFAQSRVQRGMVAAGDQPTLVAAGGASRQRQSETGSATRLLTALSPASQTQSLIDFISDPFALYQAGFDASWEPDLWGRVRRSLEAADAQMEEADAGLAQVQLGLLSEVARTYFQLRGVQTQQELLRQDIARVEELITLARLRYEGGLGNESELISQQIVLSELTAREPALREQEATALNALSYLLGEEPGSVQSLLSDNVQWSLAAMPDLALGLPSDVVASRPDIRASEARLRQATARLGIAQAELYPRVMLGAGLGLESLESGEFADWGSHQWSIGPRFSLPLFDQGRRKAAITLRELQQQEAAIDYQRVVLGAWREVDSALNRYTAQRQRDAALQDKLQREGQAYELVLASYRNGLIDYRQVLAAQQREAMVRREIAESEMQLALNLVGVFKSLGRAAPIQGGQASS